MLSVLTMILSAWPVAAQSPCPKVTFPGYKFQKSVGHEHRYYNSRDRVTLVETCLSPKTKFESVVENFSKESTVRNTTGDAVYFEFNHRGTFKRIYVVERQPVRQYVFSTRKRNRAALDDTQLLIEKQFKKTKNPASDN